MALLRFTLNFEEVQESLKQSRAWSPHALLKVLQTCVKNHMSALKTKPKASSDTGMQVMRAQEIKDEILRCQNANMPKY